MSTRFPIRILTQTFLFAASFCSSTVVIVDALSSSSSSYSANYMKLHNALFSPSGKLTLSPELIIPEPRDSTGMLLQMNAINTLSSRIRCSQTNIAFVHGTSTSIQIFISEQQQAAGNFPGPVPVVYCPQTGFTTVNSNEIQLDDSVLKDIANSGAQGILIPVPVLCSQEGTYNEDVWTKTSKAAISVGLEPIPELIFEQTEEMSKVSEKVVELLINKLCLTGKTGIKPVACVCSVVLRNNSEHHSDIVKDNEDDDDISYILQEKESIVSPVQTTLLHKDIRNKTTMETHLPRISKEISKSISVLGSIRVLAGDNQLTLETASLKSLGYTGAFLRKECIPGYDRLQMNADSMLEIVSRFWEACITDLKSTRSKNFGFRSKNNMDMSTADKWMRYRKNILDSGALGDLSGESESIGNGAIAGGSSFNPAAGDYKGFA